MKIYITLVTFALLTSCAVNVKYEEKPNPPFEATRYDLYGIIAFKPKEDPPDAFDFIYSPFFKPFILLDLPISLIADIITFPYDLYNVFVKTEGPVDTKVEQE